MRYELRVLGWPVLALVISEDARPEDRDGPMENLGELMDAAADPRWRWMWPGRDHVKGAR